MVLFINTHFPKGFQNLGPQWWHPCPGCHLVHIPHDSPGSNEGSPTLHLILPLQLLTDSRISFAPLNSNVVVSLGLGFSLLQIWNPFLLGDKHSPFHLSKFRTCPACLAAKAQHTLPCMTVRTLLLIRCWDHEYPTVWWTGKLSIMDRSNQRSLRVCSAEPNSPALLHFSPLEWCFY